MHEGVWVWLVTAELDDGVKVQEFVAARSGPDACVILGDRVRADRGVAPGGFVGMRSVQALRVDEGSWGHVVNPQGPFTSG